MAKPKTPAALNEFGEPWLTCPSCSSRDVAVTAEQMFMANTGKHWCHSVKSHDSNAKARCLACDWGGERHQLIAEVDVPVQGSQS